MNELKTEKTAKNKPEKKNTNVKHRRHIRKGPLIFLIVLAVIAAVVGGSYLKYHQLHSLLQSLPGGLGSVFEEKDGGTESSDQEKQTLEQQLEKNLESQKDSSGLSDSLMNILIVGVDSRDADFTGRSDAMVLCSIDETNNRILMTSLLRDTYVKIPDYGSNRLNAAYAYGGATLLSSTIKANYGIQVDRTVAVNFIFVKEFVDAIGGVDLELTSEEIKVMNDYIRDMNDETFNEPESTDQLTSTKAGTYHLNGKQALAYARDRYSIGSDFDRTSRQRKVIEQCMQVVKGKSLSELNSLMEQFLPKIATDLSESDCAKLLLMLFHIGDYTVDTMALPVAGTYEALTISGMSVIGVDFDKNFAYWKAAVQGTMPSAGATASTDTGNSVVKEEDLPAVDVDDYTKVPGKYAAVENQALAEQYAAHYNTKVQYVVDASKQGTAQYFDSKYNLLFEGDTIPDNVIILYYTGK